VRRLLATVLVVGIAASRSLAADSFVASCQSTEARRFDGNNGVDAAGSKLPDSGKGWSTEDWWGSDEIVWRGGSEILLNRGKLPATIVDRSDRVFRATYTDANNLYVVVLDTETGLGTLSQSQTAVVGKSRRVMTRSAALHCTIKSR